MSSFAEFMETALSAAIRTRDDMHAYQDGQRGAVQFLKDNPFSALFIDMGLGKTIISLTTILDLAREFEIGCTLVIGPLRVVKQTWPNDIAEWRHTAGMTYSFIRDEVLVDAINAAGAKARLDLKSGMAHPDVNELVMRSRKVDVRKRVKNMRASHGISAAQSTQLFPQEVAKAALLPLTEKEKKLYVSYRRRLMAREAIREHKRQNPATIYAINREQVAFLVDAWGSEWPYEAVFVDESSSLKDHSTKRFKALAKVRQYMQRMHQLTATPAAESYLHLYPQIYLLDQGERLGSSFTDFTDKYFKHNKYTFTYSLLEGSADKIAEKIADICLTMKAEDYLKLEDPVPIIRDITLDDKSMAFYDKMETSSIVELNGREIEAETAASLSNKLLQIASGVLYETYFDEDMDTDDMLKVKKVHNVHTLKIDDMVELVDECNGEPLLVAYHYKSSLDRLVKAFPKAKVMDKEGKCIKDWNAGKIPMLLMHPQSGGHGLNLQRGGRHVVFYDMPWSLELYLQFIGRLARQGQTKVVFVHHLIATGTLDELVYSALRSKRNAQDALFARLKSIRKRLSGPRKQIVDEDDDEL
jgi:hypothetical protein